MQNDFQAGGRVYLLDVLDQLDEHLGVGVRVKGVALAGKGLAKRRKVLDNAVVLPRPGKMSGFVCWQKKCISVCVCVCVCVCRYVRLRYETSVFVCSDACVHTHTHKTM